MPASKAYIPAEWAVFSSFSSRRLLASAVAFDDDEWTFGEYTAPLDNDNEDAWVCSGSAKLTGSGVCGRAWLVDGLVRGWCANWSVVIGSVSVFCSGLLCAAPAVGKADSISSSSTNISLRLLSVGAPVVETEFELTGSVRFASVDLLVSVAGVLLLIGSGEEVVVSVRTSTVLFKVLDA